MGKENHIQDAATCRDMHVLCAPAITNNSINRLIFHQIQAYRTNKGHGNLSKVMRHKQHVSLFWTPPKQGNKN
jgi:hypothetical protein